VKSGTVIMLRYGDATAFAVEVKQLVIMNDFLFRNERGSALLLSLERYFSPAVS
jgi:hypothetical protein